MNLYWMIRSFIVGKIQWFCIRTEEGSLSYQLVIESRRTLLAVAGVLPVRRGPTSCWPAWLAGPATRGPTRETRPQVGEKHQPAAIYNKLTYTYSELCRRHGRLCPGFRNSNTREIILYTHSIHRYIQYIKPKNRCALKQQIHDVNNKNNRQISLCTQGFSFPSSSFYLSLPLLLLFLERQEIKRCEDLKIKWIRTFFFYAIDTIYSLSTVHLIIL